MRLNSKRPSGRGNIERYGIEDTGGYSLGVSSVSPDDISVIMQGVTRELRMGLPRVGVTSPLIIHHGDIYERAMKELASSAINAINMNQPLGWPADEVYFFTYSRRGYLFCEC